ncbi:NAD-dependent epimerase/dehydratase family protein, partial [Candidatus Pelagibacter sp.]|nr:NAD-dependent epimerase/dehydratase family protein [Candidatus Pelagibacter sp.]
MNIFENQNILVTGGTGMVGIALVNLLKKYNAKITVVTLDDFNPFEKDITLIKKDLRSYENCKELCKNKDYIFHLAGIKGSPAVALKQPANFFVPTVLFNTSLLQAAYEANPKHILYTSSVGVYSPAEVFYEDDVWKTFPSENDKFAGWAKRMGELQMLSYEVQDNFKNYSVIRPANIYGPFDNFDKRNSMVIPSLIRKASEAKGEIEVWGDGSAIRDFVYCEDVARCMIHAVENKISLPLNVGSGSGITIKELVETIVNNIHSDKKIKIKWDTTKPSGDKIRVMSMKRASETGFKCETSIEVGLKKTIEWFGKNNNLEKSKYNSFK